MRAAGKRNAADDPEKRITHVTVAQAVYLSASFFMQNDLLSYASACTFGFLFSFIPIVMLIVVVLVRFLHTSPETVTAVLSYSPDLVRMLNVERVITSIQGIHTVTNFEIVISITIILMARRFFSSVVLGIRRIFRHAVPSRPLIHQLIILAGEAIIIILVSVIIFLAVTFHTIAHLPILDLLASRHPLIASSASALFISLAPFFLIFLLTAFCYKAGTRTRPTLFISIVMAAGSTGTFYLFQKFMKIFINVNRYNLVYGVLSNTIVLLMEVFVFFVIFLFFAQLLYVCQYFDILLLSELYLLPGRDELKPKAVLRRLLFIRPDALVHDGGNVLSLQRGDYVYKSGESGTDSFYVLSGTVQIARVNNLSYLDRGTFFGETACILDETRTEDAQACTPVTLMRIPKETFFSLIEHNRLVNRKALSQISSYFAKFYGRTEEFPL